MAILEGRLYMNLRNLSKQNLPLGMEKYRARFRWFHDGVVGNGGKHREQTDWK